MSDTKRQAPEDGQDELSAGELCLSGSELGAGELTAMQDKAIMALLSSPSVEAAAKKTGVSDRTLHRWLREPAFRQSCLAARRQVMEQAVGCLQRASLGAVETLVRNLKCGVPGTEVRAAQVILEAGTKGVEMMEFEDRLTAIEQTLEK